MFNINSSKSSSQSLEISENRMGNDMNLDNIALYLIGTRERFRENIIIPRTAGPIQLKTTDQKFMQSLIESCFAKTIWSSAVGGGLGGAVGLFSSSVNSSTAGIEKQQTVREVFREMKTTTLGYAKNFAAIGFIYTAFECAIESYRGKYDWKIDACAGGLTGGILALRAGVTASLLGTAAGTAFALVLFYFTHKS